MAVSLATGLAGCTHGTSSWSAYTALDVDSGWHRTRPITFAPQWSDSTARYDIALAVRHTNRYAFANLCLTVDLLTADGSTSRRQQVNMQLADAYGNWRGAGFGTLYQSKTIVARGITPQQANTVVAWQTMSDKPTVTQIAEIGIVVQPSTTN